MKAMRIYYEKCINLGNYENEKIGIEILLEDDDTAKDAMNKAREFVFKQSMGKRRELENIMDRNAVSKNAYEAARRELNDLLDENDFPF